MKRLTAKTILSIVSLMLVTSCKMDTNPGEILIPKSFLVSESGFSALNHVEYADEFGLDIKLMEQAYPNIIVDSLFTTDSKLVQGFDFQIESANFGIAKVNYTNDQVLESIEFYNQFDLTLREYFDPSFKILFFEDDLKFYLYESLGEKIYSFKNDSLSQIPLGW